MIWPTVVTVRTPKIIRRFLMFRSSFTIGLDRNDSILINDPAFLTASVRVHRGSFQTGNGSSERDTAASFCPGGKTFQTENTSVSLRSPGRIAAVILLTAAVGFWLFLLSS